MITSIEQDGLLHQGCVNMNFEDMKTKLNDTSNSISEEAHKFFMKYSEYQEVITAIGEVEFALKALDAALSDAGMILRLEEVELGSEK